MHNIASAGFTFKELLRSFRVSNIGKNLVDLQNVLDYKQVALVQLAETTGRSSFHKSGRIRKTHKAESFVPSYLRTFVSSIVFVGQFQSVTV